jgi:hypothetical protein
MDPPSHELPSPSPLLLTRLVRFRILTNLVEEPASENEKRQRQRHHPVYPEVIRHYQRVSEVEESSTKDALQFSSTVGPDFTNMMER